MTKAIAHKTTTTLGRKALPAVEITFTVTDRQLLSHRVEDIVKWIAKDAEWRLMGHKSTLIDEDVDTNPHL
jgi:hypothetical protein